MTKSRFNIWVTKRAATLLIDKKYLINRKIVTLISGREAVSDLFMCEDGGR